MSDYFTYVPLTANTVARAADVNTRFQGVSAGFDLLPPPQYLFEDRVTWSVDSGAANAYVATPPVPLTAYNTGTHISMQAMNTNSGPSTLNVSGLGVKQIVRADGTPLAAGDIVAGQVLDMTYDGTAFRLAMAFADISPAGVASKIAAAGAITINGLLTVNANAAITGTLTVNAVTVSGAFNVGSVVATTVTASGNVTAAGLSIGGVLLDAPTAFGVSLVEASNNTAARTLLGLGTMATETAANYALKASPAFTGVPTAPTAGFGDNTTQIATTAYVQANLPGLGTYAPLASPTFTGDPKAPTPATADNDTSIATTAYVKANLTSYAPLASPALTGTPTAPTATGGTNTTQLATTAFVQAAVGGIGGPYLALTGGTLSGALTGTAIAASGGSGGFFVNPRTGTGNAALFYSPAGDDVRIYMTGFGDLMTFTPSLISSAVALTVPDAAYGAGWNGSNGVPTRNAVYDQMELKAPLASPALTGTPTAPTAPDGTSSTQIASTGFVQSVISAKAPLASPALTGTPTAPTPATADNTTKVATTAYVQANLVSYLTSANAAATYLTQASAAATYITPGAVAATYAPLASPALTGNPTAPLQSGGNDTSRIASTAFVQQERRTRVQTAGSNSITPTFTDDLVSRWDASGAITLNNPTGTAVDGHGIVIRIKDNGTPRTISYGSQYRAVGVTLPTTTVTGKMLYLGMVWASPDGKWDVVSVSKEA